VADLLTRFREEGAIDLAGILDPAGEVFDAARLDDATVARVIRATYERRGIVVDPHTAVGLGAAALCHDDPTVPVVCVATAHPAKFPEAVEAAIGVRPELPPGFAEKLERPERYRTLPNDLGEVEDHVATVVEHRLRA
jgi:threonine synthase